MIGKVIKYNQNNINTDLIIPARYLISSDSKFLASHCMEDLDPQFTDKVLEKNYSILVIGSNFGCGSSREQAPIALKSIGITCIIASSYARIFFRNAINIGLQIIEFLHIEHFKTGDKLEVDSDNGLIRNLTTIQEYITKKQPEFIQKIVEEGGLINYAKKYCLL